MDNGQIAPADVLGFWFSEEARPFWFEKDAGFDAALESRFRAAHERAAKGELDAWNETPEGALARILLLDQIPRNLFRGTPRAFATDASALTAAQGAIARRFDGSLSEEQRAFIYMPLMHSEALADQEAGVVLYVRLGRAENLDYMIRHRDVIARFGRFPHRNAILGRASTPEETVFLEDPQNWF